MGLQPGGRDPPFGGVGWDGESQRHFRGVASDYMQYLNFCIILRFVLVFASVSIKMCLASETEALPQTPLGVLQCSRGPCY